MMSRLGYPCVAPMGGVVVVVVGAWVTAAARGGCFVEGGSGRWVWCGMLRLMSSLLIVLPCGLTIFLRRSGWFIVVPIPQCLLLVHSNRGACLKLTSFLANCGF